MHFWACPTLILFFNFVISVQFLFANKINVTNALRDFSITLYITDKYDRPYVSSPNYSLKLRTIISSAMKFSGEFNFHLLGFITITPALLEAQIGPS